jgi:Flp pilus assembly protein TadD
VFYWVLIPPYLLARTWALGSFRHVSSELSLTSVFFTWPSLFWFWVKHLVWPAGLSTFYDLAAISHPSWRNFALPALAVIGLVGVFAWQATRSRKVAFSLAWLVLPLLPLLDIRVFPLDDFAHDRYLYLPSIGLAILIGSLVQRLPEGDARILGSPANRILPTALLGFAMFLSTVYQSPYFANQVAFFEHCVTHAPRNMYARNNLAWLMIERGQFEAALPILEEVHLAHPEYWEAAFNLGYTYYRLGRTGDAEKQFIKAIRISPRDPNQFVYLGMTQLRLNQLDEAERAIRHAIAIREGAYGYHFALGMVLKLKGNLAGARAEFNREVERHPQNVEAVTQLNELNQELQRAPANVEPAD